MEKLLDRLSLEKSSVVANSMMNRERGVESGNSYEKELAFNPVCFLQQRLQNQKNVAWLDVCCGTGRALIETAQIFQQSGCDTKLKLVGIDLVSFFQTIPSEIKFLQFIETSIFDWQPSCEFDLITCVHGLHYLGDKVGVIQQVLSWLKTDGIFRANIDLNNLKSPDRKNTGRAILKMLKQASCRYYSSKRLLVCEGKKVMKSEFQYLGADDQSGINYTGQPAVDSYYTRI